MIEATGQAEFQLGAEPRWRPDTRRETNLQTVIDRSGIEHIPASVQRGMTGVSAIDEPGALGADHAHPHAHIGHVPDRVRPGGREADCGSR